MSDKVKLQRLLDEDFDEPGVGNWQAYVAGALAKIVMYFGYLAETIETLAADMMERGETVGELGEKVEEWQSTTLALSGQVDMLVGGHGKLGERLDELASKVAELETSRQQQEGELRAICRLTKDHPTRSDWQQALQRIQALEAANSGREGGPDISDPHGHAVSDKPSAGEISASEVASSNYWHTVADERIEEIGRQRERAQAWEAVADKLYEGLLARIEPNGGTVFEVDVLAEYEALKGGKP